MMYLEGYDISVYQATTPSLAGKAFCFARAGYGSSSVDARYAYHAANIRKAGVVLGAYWFLYLGQDNALAVKTFLATAGAADLLVLDVEGGANNATGYALATDFIAKVHAAGRKIGLYHSLSGFPHLGQDFDWVAYWTSTPPPISWTFWQYGGSGIDADRFNGDEAALAALVSEASMGFPVTLTIPLVIGTGNVASGVTATRLVDGTTTKTPALTAVPMVAASHTGGSGGFVLNLNGEAYFIYRGSVTFTPTPPTGATPDQVAAAVLAGRRTQYDADLAAANADPVNIGPRP